MTRHTRRAPLTRLLALADAASRADDVGSVAGAKAQRLARALHAGVPVLPGWVPFLASTVRSCCGHVPGCPAVPGIAVGHLVRSGQDERSPARHEGAILLVDRPLPAQAIAAGRQRGCPGRGSALVPAAPALGHRHHRAGRAVGHDGRA